MDALIEKLKDQDTLLWVVVFAVVGGLVYTGKVKPEVLEGLLLAIATKAGTKPRLEGK
jgi:hypothetical protein